MKKVFILAALALMIVLPCTAQEAAAPKPNYWTAEALTTLSFRQTSLIDWAAGGNGSATFGSTIDAKADYAKDKITFKNRLQMAYGFTQTFGVGFQKNADYIILNDDLGYTLKNGFSGSLGYSFKSQISPGYSGNIGSDIVSRFFAPATMSLGAGVSWEHKGIKIVFTPLTGNVQFVSDPDLRSRYGNEPDKLCRWELGAKMRFEAGAEVQGLKISTTFDTFSNYLKNPQNMTCDWTLAISAPLTKFISFSLNCRAIYDDKIKFKSINDASGNPILDDEGNVKLFPALQFQEIAGITFSYTFK
ncbi:MAG: DUF3078 domain-containing protein [Bacteroidales bacterium]|nr:DUF3078 domain-containing protein [Bacteroidales bacterium]MBQ9528782.1 DUF3078 domain-containing protein [Bacteroidales bacterium]